MVDGHVKRRRPTVTFQTAWTTRTESLCAGCWGCAVGRDRGTTGIEDPARYKTDEQTHSLVDTHINDQAIRATGWRIERFFPYLCVCFFLIDEIK